MDIASRDLLPDPLHLVSDIGTCRYGSALASDCGGRKFDSRFRRASEVVNHSFRVCVCECVGSSAAANGIQGGRNVTGCATC